MLVVVDVVCVSDVGLTWYAGAFVNRPAVNGLAYCYRRSMGSVVCFFEQVPNSDAL